MRAWRATLEKFEGFGKQMLFVPGHGQVCGQDCVSSFRAVFDDLAEHAKRMHAMGVPAEEAAQRYVVPERFKNFVVFSWSLCPASAINKYYEEFKAGHI